MNNPLTIKVTSFKMRTEVPELRRCCFCLPLRRGLIAFGYFKLIFAFLMVFILLSNMYGVFDLFTKTNRLKLHELIVFIILLAITILDIILHILFLIGAHKKDTKFLRVYYFYSLTMLVLTTLLYLISTGYLINLVFKGILFFIHPVVVVFVICLMFISLVIHAYVVLLVRSEITKLDNIGSFKFINNAAEAECTLRLEQDYDLEDKSNTTH